MKKYLTITELAERCGITRQAVHKAIIQKRLPATRAGNIWLINKTVAVMWEKNRKKD